MKNTEQIVAYIDERLRHMLERPRSYALNPVSLEQLLDELDTLRMFIVSDSEGPPQHKYSDYLFHKGHGAAMFCHQYYGGVRKDERDDDVFEKLCQFWREYLIVRDKLPRYRPGDSDGGSTGM